MEDSFLLLHVMGDIIPEKSTLLQLRKLYESGFMRVGWDGFKDDGPDQTKLNSQGLFNTFHGWMDGTAMSLHLLPIVVSLRASYTKTNQTKPNPPSLV